MNPVHTLQTLTHEQLVGFVDGRLHEGAPMPSRYVRNPRVPAVKIRVYPKRRREPNRSLVTRIPVAALDKAEFRYADFFREPLPQLASA